MTPLFVHYSTVEQKTPLISRNRLAPALKKSLRIAGALFCLILGIQQISWGQCEVNVSGDNPLADTLTLNGMTGSATLNASSFTSINSADGDCDTYLFYDSDSVLIGESLSFDCDSLGNRSYLVFIAEDASGTNRSDKALTINVLIQDITSPVIVDTLEVGPICDTLVKLNTSNDYEYVTTSLTDIGTSEGDCFSELTWTTPELFDNCSIDAVSVTFSNGNPAPDSLPGNISYSTSQGTLPGTIPFDITTDFYGNSSACPDSAVTVVTYTVTDGSGNSATCSFQVAVFDDEEPVWDDPITSNFLNALENEVDLEWDEPSETLEVVLDCNSPTFQQDLDYLVNSGVSPPSTGTFIPSATDNCTPLASVTVALSDSSETDLFCGSSSVTVNATTYNPNKEYSLSWITSDLCGNTTNIAAPDNRFKLVVYVVDEVSPYLSDNGTGDTSMVKVPLTPTGFVLESDTLVFTADTLCFFTSGEYALDPNTCGIEISGDTLMINDAIDCTGVEYGWQFLKSVDCENMATGLATGGTITAGNNIASSPLFLPVGVHEFAYIATDTCGNASKYTFAVEVKDDTPPSFANCPVMSGDTVELTNVSGVCSAIYSWQQPFVSDSCGVDTTILTILDPDGQETINPVFTTLPGSISITPNCTNQIGLAGDFAEVNWFESGTGATTAFDGSTSFTITEEDTGSFGFYFYNISIIAPKDGIISFSVDACGDPGELFPNNFAVDVVSDIIVPEFNPTYNDENCVGSPDDDVEVLVSEGDTLRIYVVLNGTAVAMSVSQFIISDFAFVCTDNSLNVLQSADTTIAFANFPQGVSEVEYVVIDDKGNRDTCEFFVRVNDDDPPIAISQDITVDLDANGEASVVAFDIDGGSADNCSDSLVYKIALDISPNDSLPDMMPTDTLNFTCSDTGDVSVVLVICDEFNNADTVPATITIRDITPPVIMTMEDTIYLDASGMAVVTADSVNNGSTDNCGIESLSVSPTDFSCADIGKQNVTLTATDAAGNSNSANASVVIVDNIPPTALCFETILVELDQFGDASITTGDIDSMSSDNCTFDLALDASTFNCDDVGANNVTLTVTDGSGNAATCTTIVNVEDNVAPQAVCQDLTVQLDDTGRANFTGNQIDGGSTDACGIATYEAFPTSFDCDSLGERWVTLVVTDVNGNKDSCQSIVTVEDNILPTVLCVPTIELVLDGNGQATLSIPDVNNGSFDNCSLVDSTLSKTAFDCSDVGTESVTLTYTDIAGNTNDCESLVTIVDDSIPTALCVTELTIELNASGNAVITTADVDNGSSDNCDFNLSLNQTDFDCTDVGSNTVILTATDVNGNASTCSVNAMVVDNIAPNAVCQDVTVTLDNNGMGSITGEQLNSGSTDNCNDVTLEAQPASYDCDSVGNRIALLIVTDGSGNKDTCEANVTVVETTLPEAICAPDFTVQLDNNGEASITVEDIDNGSTDNCAIVDTTLSRTDFNCDDIGTQTVTLTVTDGSGNAGSCQTNVTIEDTVPPVADCVDEPVVVTLDPSGLATITVDDIDEASSDNCGTVIREIDQDIFNCSDAGSNIVTLTVTDGSGNAASCMVEVIVEDDTAPEAVCADLTVSLDANGEVTVSGEQLNGGSQVSCFIDALIASPNTFNCDDLGANTVELIVVEESGNRDTCESTVTVLDELTPVANCFEEVVLYLDENGQATLTFDQVDSSSFDNCSLVDSSLTRMDFGCGDTETPVSVTLTLTDGAGNSDDCSTLVTVLDTTPPAVVCQDITVELDNGGSATVTAEQIDNGSNDECGIADLELSQTSFNCDNVGDNSVILTVTDNSGNTNTCTATVTIEDSQAASLVFCPGDIVVDNDEGMCGAVVNFDLPLFSDNCAGADSVAGVLTTPLGSGDFFPIETTTVTYSYSDGSGNAVSCNFTVTVNDVEDPIISLSPDTVVIEAADNCEIQINDFSEFVSIDVTDNCPDVDFVTSPLSPVTFGLGINAIAIVAQDASGNTTTDTFYVVVDDNVAPIVSCRDEVNVNLDDNLDGGTFEVDAGTNIFQFGAADENCGVASKEFLVIELDEPFNLFSQTHTFTCAEVGEWTVEYRVADINGNFTTCQIAFSVSDVTDPIASCQDITVMLDANGEVTITPEDVDDGSDDNCGFGLAIFRNGEGNGESLTFTCMDEEAMAGGPVEVTLEVTDDSGNQSSCLAFVTVVDDILPTINCSEGYIIEEGLAPGINVADQTLAQVVDVESLDGATPFQGTDIGSGCAQDFFPAGLLCDEAPNTDNPDANTKSNINSGPLWANPQPGSSAGIIVIDLGVRRTLNQATIFQMYAEASAKVTDVELFIHPTLGNTAPLPTVTDGWMQIVNGTIGAGTPNFDSTTVVDPTTLTFSEIDTRYVLLIFRNSGDEEFIGVRNVKLFTPDIPLEGEIEVNTDEGLCSSKVTIRNPQPEDNCGIETYDVQLIKYLGDDGDTGEPIFDTTTIAITGDTFMYDFTDVTRVQYVARDKAGNEVSCEYVINVIDEEPPVVQCPEDDVIRTSSMNNEGDCFGDYEWVHPVPTDNCSDEETTILTLSYEDGDNEPNDSNYPGPEVVIPGDTATYAFPIGVTKATYVAEDQSGNRDTCMFTITVVDDEDPQIIDLPDDVVLDAVSNNCDNIVSWTRPTFADNCGVDPNSITEEISDPGVQQSVNLNFPFAPDAPALASFPVGVTVVKYTVKDLATNQNIIIDSFTVTVVDNDAPAFSNCADDELPACPQEMVDSYIDVVTITDCSLDTVYQTPAPGTTLQELVNQGLLNEVAVDETFEVKIIAADAFGNIDSCVIEVTLTDEDVPEPVLNTLPGIISECGQAIVPAPLATNCNGDEIQGMPLGNLNVEKISSDPDVYLFSFTGTEDVVWIYPDPVTGNTASQVQTITISPDVELPEVVCPKSQDVVNGFQGSFDPVNAWTIGQEGGSNGSINIDNAPSSIIITGANTDCGLLENTEDNLCITIPRRGMIMFDWEWSSEDSNASDDPFGYTLNNNFVQLTDNDGGSGQVGSVSLEVFPGDEFCFSQRSMDACFGGASTVLSNFVFMGIFKVATDPGACVATGIDSFAIVPGIFGELLPGEYADSCDNANDLLVEYELSGATNVSRTAGADAGVETFNHGTTLVTYYVTDQAGNESSCSFPVMVKDMEAPVISNIPLDTLVNCDAIPDPAMAEVSDNCTPTDNIEVIFMETVIADSLEPCPDKYILERKWVALDTCGNSDTVVQILQVQDTTAPVWVNLPNMITEFNEVNECGREVTIIVGGDDAVDNCSNGVVYAHEVTIDGETFFGGDTATYFFPVGTTNVIFTATDACGNSTTDIVEVQIIDNQPPTLGCIDNLSFALPPSGELTVDPNLMVALLVDNCTDAKVDSVTQSVFTCEDATGMPINVIIYASDDYQNTISCTVPVEIQENVKPEAVCTTDTIEVYIDAGDGTPNSGIAAIDAQLLDGGSTDNCADPEDLIFSVDPSNLFDCDQLGLQEVLLKVEDPSGNFDKCQAMVMIMDTIRPSAICAEEVDVFLDAQGTDTLMAMELDMGSFDNCSINSITVDGGDMVAFNCNMIGIPQIVSFEVTDNSGNSDECFTLINVIDTVPPMAICQDQTIMLTQDSTGEVIISADLFDGGSADVCGNNLTFLANNAGTLAFDCEDLGDNPITLTVTDDFGNSSECTATLTVKPAAPVIFTAGVAEGPAGAFIEIPITVENFFQVRSFDLDLAVLLDTVAEVDSIVNKMPSGFLVEGTPGGPNERTVVWNDQGIEPVTLNDGDTILCIRVQLVGAAGDSSMVTISSQQSEPVSQGCAPTPVATSDVIFNSPGKVKIDLNTSAVLSGQIRRDNNDGTPGGPPVKDVFVYLSGMDPFGNPVLDTVITDSTGTYSFTVPAGSDVTITPVKDVASLPENGVSGVDGAIIRAHVLSLVPIITNPYRLLAGDVNLTGSGFNDPNVVDAFNIQDVAAGNRIDEGNFNAFGNTAWQFVPAAFMFTNPQNPWIDSIPSQITYNAVIMDMIGDFVAIKSGDVNGDANTYDPLQEEIVEGRSSKLLLHLNNQPIVKGEEVTITFTAENFTDLVSYQFTLGFDADAIDYVDATLPEYLNSTMVGETQIKGGRLAIVWLDSEPNTLDDGSVTFDLTFYAKENLPSLEGLFELNNTMARVEAHNANYQALGVELVLDSKTTVTSAEEALEQNAFYLFQNRPNPFKGQTTVGFVLPDHGSATLTLFDVAGRVVYRQKDGFEKGYNEVIIDAQELPAHGIYFYQLEFDGNVAMKRMILSEQEFFIERRRASARLLFN